MIRTSKSAKNKEKSKTVSVIIPVFNEEKTVENITKYLLTSPLVDEVICVNDGSTDKSLKILKKFGKKIKVVSFIKNYGKGHALAEGIKKSQSEIVVFFDSDLIRFCHGHIEAILDPIFKGKVRVVLGYSMPRKNHFFASSPFSINVTGQRAYYKEDLLPHLKQMAKTRYGVEIFLNSLFKKNQTSKIPLINLTHVWTHQKYKPHKALKQYFMLGTEIAKEVGRTKFKEYSDFTKSQGTANLKIIKREINNRLLAKGYYPLFFWNLASYYYKKSGLKDFYNYLFKD